MGSIRFLAKRLLLRPLARWGPNPQTVAAVAFGPEQEHDVRWWGDDEGKPVTEKANRERGRLRLQWPTFRGSPVR